MRRVREPLSEREMPRFAGPTTFMKYPLYDRHDPAPVAVLGVPFDGGTTFRSGARMGPEAIRRHSAGLYPYHRHHRRLLHQHRDVADAGDVAVVPMSVERTYAACEARLREFPVDTRVLLLGGDHSVVLPHLRVVASKGGPVALVHLDAHHDLWDEYWGDQYNHATVFRRALEEGLIDPNHSIQIGIRGSLDDAEEDRYGHTFGIRQISTDEWYQHGHQWVVDKLRERLDGAPRIYLSVDIDVVDPAFAIGTGTPEAGGPTSHMVLKLLEDIGRPLVGADVVELAPDLDPSGASSLFAATVAQDLLFLLTEAD
ncbi:MAG: agmatinase [Firmicutes bacterium]|nr:agmatinase [Bacillota bacterium]